MPAIDYTQQDMVTIAKQSAQAYALEPALVCAVCEQESGWNRFAMRYEPAFYRVYVLPLGLQDVTEAQARAFSWGLMQVMGEVAREKGFLGQPLSRLCDPYVGLDVGCKHLASRLAIAGGDVTKGLLLWNGGGNPNYPAEVLARKSKYEPAATAS